MVTQSFVGQSPNDPIHILFVEDNPDDVQLMMRELERARLNVLPKVVYEKEGFVNELDKANIDIIVADYQLHGWTGMDALTLAQWHKREIPFILVTGVLGEETAVECIKQGACDYVVKDRLSRLPFAIRRALQEACLREEGKATRDSLRESEILFRTLAESIHSAIFVYLGSRCRYANREAELLTGYTRNELFTMNSLHLIHRDSRDSVIQMGFSGASEDLVPHYEIKIVARNGETKWLDMRSSPIEIEGKRGRLLTAVDMTHRKTAEDEIRRLVTLDPLTGLANYRRLLEVFEAELGRSRRTGRNFSLLLLDLDDLKGINDAYGHDTGSRALRRIGSILQGQCRSIDISARYGGDEFAVILPETSAADAHNLAFRVVASLRGDQEKPALSVSFGAAACPESGETFEDVLRVADRGLYLMKGREIAEARFTKPAI